jgi:hypothetical protein
LLPTELLFTFHPYVGNAPPFVADAVKVTNVPEQSGAGALLVIETVGVTIGTAVTDLLEAEEVPQLLPASTFIVPLLLPTVTVMELVVEEPVQPTGRPQV